MQLLPAGPHISFGEQGAVLLPIEEQSAPPLVQAPSHEVPGGQVRPYATVPPLGVVAQNPAVRHWPIRLLAQSSVSLAGTGAASDIEALPVRPEGNGTLDRNQHRS